MEPVYTAIAHASGDGRNDQTRTGNGILDLELPVPTEMGRPSEATNPEQLFAAGYAACFHSALKVVAQRDKLFDVETSELLWHDQLPAGGQATPIPMSYEFEGGRYVVFVAGGDGQLGSPLGDGVVAFALRAHTTAEGFG